MKLSAYVPFFNNRRTVLQALQSLQSQTISPAQIFALDDGSTDGGSELVQANGFCCLLNQRNQGRGAVRHRAMLEATGDLVVSCDATNVLPSDFIERLLPWFEDPRVAGVYGWIHDPHPKGAVSRWRARHLFKAGLPMSTSRNSPLITGGAILRRLSALEVGNFNPSLRHSEDSEMGERLLAAGFDTIFDASVPVYCNVENSLHQALERYWRWYAGKAEYVSFSSYLKTVSFSVKVMAITDLADGDASAALISLLCPHYQFWRSVFRR